MNEWMDEVLNGCTIDRQIDRYMDINEWMNEMMDIWMSG